MCDDLYIVIIAKTNFQHLCDIEVVMGLAYIMLEIIHAFIKFAQVCDTFVCDFVITMKICCIELYNMYLDFK
jgi:hypothetical protein